ncbi:MAG: fumarylacetoacetate hydrolase family protein [Actinomycetaceae bacterium]|nr:fumarylacetoacetate hydrolase family protein [Actinomycetaceae bacterium]MDU0971129.1 fumarylacetoacetate hydrolase family protein [Actinomycetaceae bacterium]
MRIARLLTPDGPTFALIDEDTGTVTPAAGSPFEDGWQPTPTEGAAPIALADAQLLAPTRPEKVVAVAKNYRAHAAEMGGEPPKQPMLFFKPPTSVVGVGHPIVLPRWSNEIHYEGELAAVIGRKAKDVAPEDALDYVLGYTCGNDVSARDAQRNDGQWARAKGFDTSCPLGPWIVPAAEVDPQALTIRTEVNGSLVQEGSTADMITDVAHLIAYASAAFTLMSGDVILTGTPAGVGPIVDGDRVTVTISGIGSLDNPVADAGTRTCD